MNDSNSRYNLEVISNDVAYIRADITAIKEALRDNYVTIDKFDPVRKIAYGAISLTFAIIVSLFGYLVTRSTK